MYSWAEKIPWRRDRLPTAVFLGFPCDSAGKEFAFNVGDLGSIPGWGKSSGEGKGYPLQYSGLENSMNCIVYGVAKSGAHLSAFHFSLSILLVFLRGGEKKNVRNTSDHHCSTHLVSGEHED